MKNSVFLQKKEIFIKTQFLTQKIMENRQTQFKTSKIVVKVKDKILYAQQRIMVKNNVDFFI